MPATRIDDKRELYLAGREPAIVEVPDLAFLMLDGHGDPNTTPAYRDAIEALYALAYAVKFAVRHQRGEDYRVMPLEGLWWTSDVATFTTDDKSEWDWTMMIMQPDPVTADIVEAARAAVAAKKPLEAISRVRFERLAEGLVAQVMHLGPFAAEGPTIARLHEFIAERGYERAGKHHEIYLSDPRRSAPAKLKTIIRQPIAAS